MILLLARHSRCQRTVAPGNTNEKAHLEQVGRQLSDHRSSTRQRGSNLGRVGRDGQHNYLILGSHGKPRRHTGSHENGDIGLRGASDHVLDEIPVARRIKDAI